VVLFCLAFLCKNKEALALSLCIEPTGWRRESALFKCSSGGGGGGSFQGS